MTMPYGPNGERTLLGAWLLGAYAPIYGALRPDQFHDPRHRVIFAALRTLTGTTDVLTVAASLADRNELELAGGTAYLKDLIESVPDVGRPRFVALCDEIVASLNEEEAA